MAEEPDVIRQEIDVTRESLTDKLDLLEGQVKEAVSTVTDTIETVKNSVESTVETVRSGVENTVDSVKTSFSDTVDTVKETFDLSRQIDHHPWGAVGCSLLAGVAAGYLLGGSRQRRFPYSQGIPGMDYVIPGYQPARPAAAHRQEVRQEPAHPGFMSTLLGALEGELGKIKETAIGALIGVARDALRETLPPSLAGSVTEIMDGVTRRVGGEPIHGHVLDTEHANEGNSARRAAAY